jgi:glycosyltransferase involved in cell wall biosynthesis
VATNTRPTRPSISVIVATYNWSAALRCALRSVQLQTLTDFEVHVVGDGCTDDSAAVVAGLGDPRFHWHNLERNSGNQSAPNNHGLRAAAADWVAYLGQDDIWFPTHLEAILRRAKETAADLVASVAVLYGPPRTGMLGLSGIFVDDSYSARDFMPPSSFAHRKALVDTIGYWQDPEAIELPTDCAFVRAAVASGARIVSTNELTTFKFGAAWRRDSYKFKPTAEQEDTLRRIESGADFRHEELIGVLHSVRAEKFLPITMPAEGQVSKGTYFRNYRKIKGVDRRFPIEQMHRVTEPKRFPVDDSFSFFEWHKKETDPRFGSFHWTGPGPRATVELPVIFDRDLAIRVHILLGVDPDVLRSARLLVNSAPIESTIEPTADQTFLLSGIARADGAQDGDLRISLEVDKTRRFCDIADSSDRRWLGLAVNWLEVAPLA